MYKRQHEYDTSNLWKDGWKSPSALGVVPPENIPKHKYLDNKKIARIYLREFQKKTGII